MKILLNGNLSEIPEKLSLLELLKQYEIDERTEGVAVAVDENLVLKCNWEAFVLQEGNKVEIVWARQGG